MLRSVCDLERVKVLAADGRQFGRIRDFYFDDQTWRIQHVIVSAEPSKFGKKQVLLSPACFDSFCEADGSARVSSSLEALESAPLASSVLPVCKQYASLSLSSPGARSFAAHLHGANPRLRSARAVTNYLINLAGDFVGVLSDMLFDDLAWEIRYLRVEQIIERKKLQFHVLPQSVERFTWATQRVVLRELQQVAIGLCALGMNVPAEAGAVAAA